MPRSAPAASLPEGPAHPALFQLAAYVTRPFTHFDALHAQFGDVFSIRLPGVGTQVIVGSQAGLKLLSTGSYESFEREANTLRFLLGGHALIFMDGLLHRQTRNLMAPPFQGERMRSYGPIMAEVTDRVLTQRDTRAALPVQPAMQEITLRVILHCVFGISEGPRFERMRELLVMFLAGMFHPFTYSASLLLSGERLLAALHWLGEAQRRAAPDGATPHSALPIKRVAEALGAIDAILFDEIERCRRAPEGRTDILASLVSARGEQGASLSREQLRDQLIMLLVAGHETTANSLCWALYHLAQRPDVVAEVRKEQTRVFAGASSAPNVSAFDAQRVRELPYLGAVVHESMRLTPIALGVARRLKHALTIDGHTLPAGTVAVPCNYLAQRDPRVWERPHAFEPERFLRSRAAVTAHFPFGLGVWRCLGAAFAEYEMRVVLARLLERYDLALAADEKGQPLLKGVTIAPATGLKLRLLARPLGQQTALATA
jgi:cytochrome P450